MEELKNIHYDAFISYRHCESDSFVAEKIHRKLESFKLPKSVLPKVKNGKKRSHWMWYIFPQMRGLGFSETSVYYGIYETEVFHDLICLCR